MKSRVLVSRSDRLGDVLLSLPALLYLRRSLPSEVSIDFLCRPEILEILTDFLTTNQIQGVAYPATLASLTPYEAISFFYAESKLMAEAYWRRVPLRCGPRSKWTSFFLLNYGVRQARSKALRNEGEYALEIAQCLLSAFGVTPPRDIPSVCLPIHTPGARLAETKLSTLGIFSQTPFLVVHPGMGGSALNLSPSDYAALIESVRKATQLPVLLSRGPAAADAEWVAAIAKAGCKEPVLEGLPLFGLMEVFRRAKWVIAPSTGPLHLAHAVGTKVIGLFPPVRSQRVERWGPWGGVSEVVTFSPLDPCPGKTRCVGKRCDYFFCMDRLGWTKLVTERLVNAHSRSGGF